MSQKVTMGRAVHYRVSETETVLGHVTAVHEAKGAGEAPSNFEAGTPARVAHVSLVLFPESGPVEFIHGVQEGEDVGEWHWPPRD